MSREPGIVCFAHCNNRRIYCKIVPTFCPICNADLIEFSEEPFRLSYPCEDATQNPCSIAVKPSRGTFLEDYTPADDLHIAIVNSQGRVFEFDSCGLVVDNLSAWRDCLSFDAIPESWQSRWDSVLEELSKSPKWNRTNYHAESVNCFTFVIDFFKALKFPNLEFCDKEQFCRLFVLPKVQETVGYISLYRNLKFGEFYIS